MNYLGRLKSWLKAKIRRITATTSKTAIAVLSAVIIVFVVSVAVFKSVRFFSWEHPGILIVVIAVAGEVIGDWNRKKTLKERLKKFFGILLVAGLLLEIAEAVKSDKKASEANLEAKQAEALAGQVNERAAKFEFEAAELGGQIAQTSNNVAEIEIASNGRTFSQEQIEQGFSQLSRYSGTTLVLFINPANDRATVNFANRLLALFKISGWNVTAVLPEESIPIRVPSNNIGIGYSLESDQNAAKALENFLNSSGLHAASSFDPSGRWSGNSAKMDEKTFVMYVSIFE